MTCGNACPTVTNGQPRCAASACGFSCNMGFHKCGASCADDTSVSSCGSSCSPCPTPPNATAACLANGTCGIGTCAAGYLDCNGDPSDGCERNVASDTSNCGRCGAVCSIANGTAACVAGTCTVATCNIGYGDCNGSAVDGCETNLQTDYNHCGACTNSSCSTVVPDGGINNGTFSCIGSACALTCDAGYHTCAGSQSCFSNNDVHHWLCAGTCVDIWSDPMHCGTCAAVCTPGQPNCVAGSCSP
jgi:hypothetical protein